MENRLNLNAEALLNTKEGQNLLKNKGAITQLASSAEGQKVKAMMEGNAAVSAAMAAGDVQALGKAISGILQTEEGARLAAQLGSLMQNNK